MGYYEVKKMIKKARYEELENRIESLNKIYFEPIIKGLANKYRLVKE